MRFQREKERYFKRMIYPIWRFSFEKTGNSKPQNRECGEEINRIKRLKNRDPGPLKWDPLTFFGMIAHICGIGEALSGMRLSVYGIANRFCGIERLIRGISFGLSGMAEPIRDAYDLARYLRIDLPLRAAGRE